MILRMNSIYFVQSHTCSNSELRSKYGDICQIHFHVSYNALDVSGKHLLSSFIMDGHVHRIDYSVHQRHNVHRYVLVDM